MILTFIAPHAWRVAHDKFKEMRNHDQEHKEFREFMKGQQQMMDFMMANPPPMLDFNMQGQNLPIYLSEYEKGFNDWT